MYNLTSYERKKKRYYLTFVVDKMVLLFNLKNNVY